MHTLPSNCRSFVAAAVQSYYIEAPEFNLCDEVINYARDKTNKYIQDAEDYGAEYILAISSISIELFKSKISTHY
ncbi:hypothetical protein [Photobacterium kishitanii]|uniref:hypothetical protein n=1 Tax=Photobacterium kishitanii TaxID=318456 RepID=UPI0027393988|nr:hypothetical protein [Photobacterium kishitanii]